MSLHQELADRLWNAQFEGAPCDAPTSTHPALTLDDAYEIQSINLTRRLTKRWLHAKAR